MKKIFSLIIGLATVCNFSSCSDADYTDKYTNPSETSTATVEKLMTGVFMAGRDYTYNTYWRMYTWDNGIMGTYAQTIGFLNTPSSVYTANDSYANNRWANFYNVLTQYRVLQSTYNKLSDTEKGTYKLFYDLAEVFMYDHLSQLIDYFGDVPFEKAGFLSLTGDVVGSYPSYDKASTLYGMILDRLGALAPEIATLAGNMNSQTAAFFPSQDFINKGSGDKWVRYTNSLRLRLATRVASQGDLAAKGKQVIAEILNANSSLVSNMDQLIAVYSDTDGFNYGQEFFDGYKDHSRASQPMLNVLLTESTLGQNDPRLPIMYSKNAAGQYKGLSTTDSYADQQTNINYSESQRVYSRIDSTTVIRNVNLISPIMMPAEVHFLRAEAFQKGWASGDAKQAFVDGMLESTKFYFKQNAVSTSGDGTKMDMPAESVVIAYAQKVWDAASNKEEAIITQKWFNFGFMMPYQAWNETRRTGYPALTYFNDATAQMLKTQPNRVRYPGSERNNNTANYNAQVQAMGGTDDAYIKIFWAK